MFPEALNIFNAISSYHVPETADVDLYALTKPLKPVVWFDVLPTSI